MNLSVNYSSYNNNLHNNNLSSLPSHKEWKELLAFQVEKLKYAPKKYTIIDQKDHLPLYDLLLKYQVKKSMKNFQEHCFTPFQTIVKRSEMAYQITRTKIHPEFKDLEEVSQKEVNISLDLNRSEMTEFQIKIYPYQVTLHKITHLYLMLMKKANLIAEIRECGIIPKPLPHERDHLFYLRQKDGLLTPSFYPDDQEDYKICPFPFFVPSNDFYPPMVMTAIIEKGNRICEDPGCIVRIDSGRLILNRLTGNHPLAPYGQLPDIVIADAKDPNSLLMRIIKGFIPSEKLVEGFVDFIPIVTSLIQQRLVDLVLLEELIDSTDEIKLIEDAKKEIEIIEEELVEEYRKDFQSEYEKKIQAEQDECKRKVISGEINETKREKKKKGPKSKPKIEKIQVVAPANINAVQTTTQPQNNDSIKIFEQARIKLEVEKKRIKKHKLVGFIKAVKKALGKAEFSNLITQNGSHLTVHTEEKEPLTLVVAHKKDRTTSGKILKKFLSGFDSLFKNQK